MFVITPKLVKPVSRSPNFRTQPEDGYIVTDSNGNASGGRTTGGLYQFVHPVTAIISTGSTNLTDTRRIIRGIINTAKALKNTTFVRPTR